MIAARRAASGVEYGVLVGLISLVAIGAVGAAGGNIPGIFATASQKISDGVAEIAEVGADAARIVLTGAALPASDNATALTVNFAATEFLSVEGLNPADLTWSVGDLSLPFGMTLDPDLGVISGAIPAAGSYAFELVASFNGEEGRAVYTIEVNGVRLAVVDISTGGTHTCAILAADGSAVCWGLGDYGKLGHGSTDSSAIPVAVNGLGPNVRAIAAGTDHTCAIDAAGAAKCWGFGYDGQIGDGGNAINMAPTQVSGMTFGVQAISAGWRHTCAIDSDGAAKCWGGGSYGQTGYGGIANTNTPIQVSGLTSGVQAISVGGLHTCAIDSDGAAKCWGYGNAARLGDGETIDRVIPTQVSGMTSGVRAISAGGTHTCAIDAAGAAKCWGNGSSGKIGDGGTTQRNTPTQVSGLTSGVRAISARSSQTCAIDVGGAAKCWGQGTYSRIGDGGTTNRATPTQVSGLTSGVRAISIGGYHICAIDASGGAQCWGQGSYGQIGDGASTERLTPVDVSAPPGV